MTLRNLKFISYEQQEINEIQQHIHEMQQPIQAGDHAHQVICSSLS